MESVNCVWDCRRSLPFDDNSVRYIFSEHFFEHLDYTEEIPVVLSECLRVLQPGGIIRIVVPDAGRYLRAYCESGWEALTKLRELRSDHFDRYTGCAYVTKMELVNEVFRQAYTHKFAYDHETLERVLLHTGFARAERAQFGVSLAQDLAIDFADRAHESLYVEGIKAG
jgi:predicted SAM-dependent methyltransferase